MVEVRREHFTPEEGGGGCRGGGTADIKSNHPHLTGGELFPEAPTYQHRKNHDQWEFQDPKMEVLYHKRPYFLGIFPYIGLKNRPYIW